MCVLTVQKLLGREDLAIALLGCKDEVGEKKKKKRERKRVSVAKDTDFNSFRHLQPFGPPIPSLASSQPNPRFRRSNALATLCARSA